MFVRLKVTEAVFFVCSCRFPVRVLVLGISFSLYNCGCLRFLLFVFLRSENIDDEKANDADGESMETDAKEDEKEEGEKKEESEEKVEEEEAKESKPVATKPVPGHPGWVIVFTNDDKVFFFDQGSQESTWHIPDSLADVPNLEEMMKTPKQRAEEGEMGLGMVSGLGENARNDFYFRHNSNSCIKRLIGDFLVSLSLLAPVCPECPGN